MKSLVQFTLPKARRMTVINKLTEVEWYHIVMCNFGILAWA